MLIGYPPDYRSNEEIGDTIKSFGRLLFWQRDNVLARVIIKARVTDLADIPHYIVISEGDFFEGVSLTVQCEILKQDLLGGMPQDEDIPPGGFDGDFVFPGQINNNLQQLNWPLWPQHHPQAADAGNVLENGDILGPDVNFPPANQEPQVNVADIEMQGPALPEDQQIGQGNPVDNPQDSTSDQPGSSVSSSSEATVSLIPDLNMAPPAEDASFQFPEVLLPIAGASPDLQIQAQPQAQHVNFLAPEIQPDELLNDEEIAA
jgi:hypothetical protein